MEPSNTLRFAINDRINNVDVGPKDVPLNLLGDFQKDVSEFLLGSTREISPSDVVVSIDEGSLVLVAAGLLAASGLWTDVSRLAAPDALSMIDPKRAEVVERWQVQAQSHPHRIYRLEDSSKHVLASVNATTHFWRAEETWVTVEKYLHGRIVNLGGKTKANVHLELETGKVLVVTASQQLLTQDDGNRLYRCALLHVTAEENLQTGELRGLNLLAFEAHHPAYDEDEFRRMVQHGTAAWADVESPSQWVESLRGESA